MNLRKFLDEDPHEVVQAACEMMIADGGRKALKHYMDYVEGMRLEADEWLDTLKKSEARKKEELQKKSASRTSPASSATSQKASSTTKSASAQATTPAPSNSA